MNCRHERVTVGRDRCFIGPVAREERQAAHGNITTTETCAACGARRSVNINQMHVEAGPWGEPRQIRAARAHELRAAALQKIAAIPEVILRRGDATATVCVDSEGMIAVKYQPAQPASADPAVVAALPPAWLKLACAARAAVLAAVAAEDEAV